MKKFLRNNGLSITMVALFLLFLAGQTLTGLVDSNEDRRLHGKPELRFAQYLLSGHYLESVFENWESEFLQMSAYVVLTAFLFQKGSAESNDPERERPDPRKQNRSDHVPWPVRKGGWIKRLYEHSLSSALFFLFLISFWGHVSGGCRHLNEERLDHGLPPITCVQYVSGARFWFESFQNWQSEFLAVFSIVFLSIWLREKDSPESKPVTAAHQDNE